LNNLGIRLSELGRREQALPATEEAVTIRRRLAQANPAAHLPNLAGSLNNLGIRLSELGRREQALPATEEAVTIRRRLAQANPAAYLPDLAIALNNLGNRLSELGRREQALPATDEALTLYRQLAQANPAAHLPNLAGSLNNLGIRLSELGRREQALPPTEEAITIYRQLAQANPATHLPNLAGSLNNLGNRLSELGRETEVVGVIETTLVGLDPGPRAELRLRLARWWASGDEPSGWPMVLDDAIAEADAEAHPQRGARARRAARRAVTEAGLDAHALEGAPAWVTAATPDEITKIIDRVVAAPSWQDGAAILRSPAANDLFTPAGQATREALAALQGDKPGVLAVLRVLADIHERGLDTVLDGLCADERHRDRVLSWVNTATWTASRGYLLAHPDLLGDPRTGRVLAEYGGDAVARRHLAIARLAGHLPLEEVYDVVVDETDAIEAALAALDRADLDQLTEIWHAAPHLGRQPFVSAYLAAVLIVRSDQPEHHEQARQLIGRAIADRATIDRTDELAWLRRFTTDAPGRLNRLAERYPDHAGILHELADLLAAPEPAVT
jgi:tetratricopeptide (TPR) repeat protein